MLPQSTDRQKQHLLTCGQPCPGQAQRRGETLTPDHSVGSTQQSRVAGVSLGLGSWGQALSSLLQLPEGDDCHALCVWSQPPDSLPRLDPLTCWYSAEGGLPGMATAWTADADVSEIGSGQNLGPE